ncbi:cyclic nucleotide-binding domain-containing protein [Bradyrhizobium yuanmingense]|nr:cyclic nucleotide-binding domain-containing protein [Bradyrhizobium sp. CB1024]UWU88661.1 cyclic nucleotide-binding domain-containing protein [Bradyrhizobium sp. CB1024]
MEEGRIRSYYAAPSGREVTLAYWFAGNFVGGPDLFGTGAHVWSSVAVERSRVTFLPGPALRAGASIGKYRSRAAGCARLQGTVLLGHGANAGDPLGDRAAASSVGLPLEDLRFAAGPRDRDRDPVHAW